jgi:hypothetical protein
VCRARLALSTRQTRPSSTHALWPCLHYAVPDLSKAELLRERTVQTVHVHQQRFADVILANFCEGDSSVSPPSSFPCLLISCRSLGEMIITSCFCRCCSMLLLSWQPDLITLLTPLPKSSGASRTQIAITWHPRGQSCRFLNCELDHHIRQAVICILALEALPRVSKSRTPITG